MKSNFKKILLFVVIPLALILFWVFSSLLLTKTISFSVLVYSHPKSAIISAPSGRLTKGEKIVGEFKAKDNYMGIVMVGFKDFSKYSYAGEDVLTFKIKEKGQDKWYYTGDFRSGSLQNHLVYPFGFPIIDNSKDRIYHFEIESLYGNESNAVAYSINNSSLFTGYQFPRYVIRANKASLVEFLTKKIKVSLTNVNFLTSSILYLLPFLVYLYVLLLFSRFKASRSIFVILIFLIMLWDVFFIQEINVGILLGLIMAWIISIKTFKISSKTTFGIAITGLLIWTAVIPLGIDYIQNNLNVWIYFFLFIGLIQLIIEEKKSE